MTKIKLKLKPSYVMALTSWIGSIKYPDNYYNSYAEMFVHASLMELEMKLKKWLCTPRPENLYTISISPAHSLSMLYYIEGTEMPPTFIYVAIQEATAQMQHQLFAKTNNKIKYPHIYLEEKP